MAGRNLAKAQANRKERHDLKVVDRSFQPGESCSPEFRVYASNLMDCGKDHLHCWRFLVQSMWCLALQDRRAAELRVSVCILLSANHFW